MHTSNSEENAASTFRAKRILIAIEICNFKNYNVTSNIVGNELKAMTMILKAKHAVRTKKL
jgi:hypothetical protein